MLSKNYIYIPRGLSLLVNSLARGLFTPLVALKLPLYVQLLTAFPHNSILHPPLRYGMYYCKKLQKPYSKCQTSSKSLNKIIVNYCKYCTQTVVRYLLSFTDLDIEVSCWPLLNH